MQFSRISAGLKNRAIERIDRTTGKALLVLATTRLIAGAALNAISEARAAKKPQFNLES